MQVAKQRGRVKLYISHGAGSGHSDPGGPEVDWFIVEPREDPYLEVATLRRHGRTVIAIDVEPYQPSIRRAPAWMHFKLPRVRVIREGTGWPVDDRTPAERASGPSSDEANRAASEGG